MKPPIFALSLAVCCGPCFGQGIELGASVGGTRASSSDLGSVVRNNPTSLARVAFGGGLRVGAHASFNTSTLLANEFGYARETASLSATGGGSNDVNVNQVYYNLVLHLLPKGLLVRPFVDGGVHLNRYGGGAFTLGNVASGAIGGSTKVGFNYGGGLKVKVLPLLQLRLDIRQFQNPKPYGFDGADGLLRQLTVTAGIAFTL